MIKLVVSSALRIQYSQRRDFLVDCLIKEFDVHPATGTANFRQNAVVYYASLKQKRFFMQEKHSPTVLSFIPPTAGMFVWVNTCFFTEMAIDLMNSAAPDPF